jgi:UDP-glucose 4-epimerase
MAEGSHGRRTVAVVGSSGFLGSELCRSLRSRGLTVLTATIDSPSVDAAGRLRPDLRDASTVYWAASRINPLLAEKDPDLVSADRDDFARFLEALRLDAPAAFVVLLSSGGTVYGSADPPHSEYTPPRPTSSYGRAKLGLEEALVASGVRSVVVRAANAYGPGQAPAPGQGVIGHWLRALLAGRPVTVFGDLATSRDYVFVDDVVQLLSDVHDHPTPPQVVNVGSGRPTTLAEVVDAIHDVVGNQRLEIDFQPRRDFDLSAAWLDVSLAWSALGWRPRTGLRDGVAQMWHWLLRDSM